MEQKNGDDIPGSSKCVKFVPFHPKNLPKGRNFTYLENPGIDDPNASLSFKKFWEPAILKSQVQRNVVVFFLRPETSWPLIGHEECP